MDNRTQETLAVLDLAPGAGMEDVKRAYRELVLIWHPDKVPEQVKERATRKFQRLTEAYRWLTQNPSVLEHSGATVRQPSQRTDQRQSEPRAGAAGPAASSDMLSAIRGFLTDRDEGVYVYPEMDRTKIVEFAHQVTHNMTFPNFRLHPDDILVFYDIDGSGEEGMAITRTKHLINNNVDALFHIEDLEDVRLEDAMFFWCQLSVRAKGQVTFQLAGYASNQAGQLFTGVLGNLIRRTHP
ncbi:MAG: J domain-containing protein [Gemmatimonadota bacterium]|nr:J domain-containing protein [Gemmatimonadota bacterium]